MTILKVNKILAGLYAVGLGIGEAALNWGDWQYAPLWIVDYMIVAALLFGVLGKTPALSVSRLKCAWVFAFAIMYMALFVSIDSAAQGFYDVPVDLLVMIGGLMGLAVVGFVLSIWTEKSMKSNP